MEYGIISSKKVTTLDGHKDWDQVLRTHFSFIRRISARIFVTLFVLASIFVVMSDGANARSKHSGPKYAGIVMDAKTGRVLYSHQANSKRHPASLTKMMTLYLMFEAIENRKLSLKTRIKMSRYAASKPPSKLGIKPGRSLSAKQAIYALVTKSANDVATAVGEHIAGSEVKFAKLMTKRARQLGMHRTTFRNASGLTAKGQLTTAKDMALLGIALREHYPKYYRYFTTRSFKYGKRKYGNHNKLLGRVKGVDGIKTGYTRAAGFNLVSSVQLNKRSIVAVVLGGKSGKSRNAQMQNLIARHLKKATRRSKRKMLVARVNTHRRSNIVVASVSLPKRGPIPVFRAQSNDPARLRIEQAHIASVAYAPATKPGRNGSVDAIRDKLLAMNNNRAPVPIQSPIAKPDSVVTASIRPQVPVGLAPMPTKARKVSVVKSGLTAGKSKATTNPGGWQVQIAAVPDQASAISFLSKARKKLPSLAKRKYGNLRDYLQPTVKNGVQLYRARFAGFKNKDSARSACKAMKKRKISCLAIKG